MPFGPAHSLGCADLPGATVDPGLDAFVPYQSFGRLLPEFETEEREEIVRRARVVDRIVLRQFVLEGGDKVNVRLNDDGMAAVSATVAGKTSQHLIANRGLGLENSHFIAELAQTFFALGIPWHSYTPPAVPVTPTFPDEFGTFTLGQTTRDLEGAVTTSKSTSVKYACSSRASFAGEPDKLNTIVVLKGTIRATQTTTTTKTSHILTLSINDLAERRRSSRDELADLLHSAPAVLAAFNDEVNGPSVAAANPSSERNPPEPVLPPDEPETSETGAVPAPQAQIGPGAGEPPPGNPALLSFWTDPDNLPTVAAIAIGAVAVLILLAAFLVRRRRDSETETEPVTGIEEAAVASSKDKPASQRPATDGMVQPAARAPAETRSQPEPVATPDVATPGKGLGARIDVLEALRAETEQFQSKLDAALKAANRDAADTRKTKQRLEQIEAQLKTITADKEQLEETAQDDRAKLNKAQEESRVLKEMVVDLKTKLAKAMAQIESSQSVIIELESASRMAIELNADYRMKTEEVSSENAALRGRVDLLEASLAERDELLEATTLTNEEIRKALIDERAERMAIEDDFNALSKDHERLLQDSETELKRKRAGSIQTEHELDSLKRVAQTLKRKLEDAERERRQLELDHHAEQTEKARLRVEHGVRARLLEGNVRELSAHIEVIEQMLRDNNIAVPDLSLTPVESSHTFDGHAGQTRPVRGAKQTRRDTVGKIVHLRPNRAEKG